MRQAVYDGLLTLKLTQTETGQRGQTTTTMVISMGIIPINNVRIAFQRPATAHSNSLLSELSGSRGIGVDADAPSECSCYYLK